MLRILRTWCHRRVSQAPTKWAHAAPSSGKTNRSRPPGKILRGHDDRESGSCLDGERKPRCNTHALHKRQELHYADARLDMYCIWPARCRESERHFSGTGEAHAPLCREAHPLWSFLPTRRQHGVFPLWRRCSRVFVTNVALRMRVPCSTCLSSLPRSGKHAHLHSRTPWLSQPCFTLRRSAQQHVSLGRLGVDPGRGRPSDAKRAFWC